MDKVRVPHPRCGDEKSDAPESKRPCLCLDGWHYIGHLVEEDGEEVEVYDRVPCRRCSNS